MKPVIINMQMYQEIVIKLRFNRNTQSGFKLYGKTTERFNQSIFFEFSIFNTFDTQLTYTYETKNMLLNRIQSNLRISIGYYQMNLLNILLLEGLYINK